MKFFVFLSVLVCVATAYPSQRGDSLAAKKEELLALEQELKGMMQRAGQCVLPHDSYTHRCGLSSSGAHLTLFDD